MVARSLTAFAALLVSSTSIACDGIYFQDSEGEVFAWDVLFDGQVVGVEFVELQPRSSLDWANLDSEFQPYDRVRNFRGCVVEYRVVERLRGGSTPLETIRYEHFTSRDECDQFFGLGDRRLVAAGRQGGWNRGDGRIALMCRTFQFPEDEIRATARRLRTEMLIW